MTEIPPAGLFDSLEREDLAYPLVTSTTATTRAWPSATGRGEYLSTGAGGPPWIVRASELRRPRPQCPTLDRRLRMERTSRRCFSTSPPQNHPCRHLLFRLENITPIEGRLTGTLPAARSDQPKRRTVALRTVGVVGPTRQQQRRGKWELIAKGSALTGSKRDEVCPLSNGTGHWRLPGGCSIVTGPCCVIHQLVGRDRRANPWSF